MAAAGCEVTSGIKMAALGGWGVGASEGFRWRHRGWEEEEEEEGWIYLRFSGLMPENRLKKLPKSRFRVLKLGDSLW